MLQPFLPKTKLFTKVDCIIAQEVLQHLSIWYLGMSFSIVLFSY